jgi:hypothetical protein
MLFSFLVNKKQQPVLTTNWRKSFIILKFFFNENKTTVLFLETVETRRNDISTEQQYNEYRRLGSKKIVRKETFLTTWWYSQVGW